MHFLILKFVSLTSDLLCSEIVCTLPKELAWIKKMKIIWAQFHQCSTYSFYARGTQKRKKDSQVISLFTLSGSTRVKAERKYVGEIDT